MDKRSASTIGLAADTLLAAATQIWNCWHPAEQRRWATGLRHTASTQVTS
ncbi:hypothetical protein [uncultured Lamprocystis sp.]|nr:hypothetical protein [uncultured Lamprocystis sp.]